MPLHVSSTCVHHQEVKIALHSLWYHHTETSEWSKITKIQIIPFWVIPRRLSSNCRRFGTHYRFHLHSPAYEDGTDSEFRNVGN